MPWLTAADLEVLQENAETASEYERLHLNRWTTSEDRLASRADLAACTTLPDPLPPVPGLTYVVSLDVGIVNDRTVLAVMHAEDSAREYRASAIVDPNQAVLIAQEARAAGVTVSESAFTAASVGRIALSLHQAIRNHRIMLPDDELLLEELVSVRLRKNTLGCTGSIMMRACTMIRRSPWRLVLIICWSRAWVRRGGSGGRGRRLRLRSRIVRCGSWRNARRPWRGGRPPRWWLAVRRAPCLRARC